MRFLLVLFLLIPGYATMASGQEYGYAIIQNDTIYGDIQINFDAGSVMVKQDSVNRMFISDIHSVTLLNEGRETYYAFRVERKVRFFQLVVGGNKPLFRKDRKLYTILNDEITELEGSKTLYQIFGKKEVRDYTFVRNISINREEGIIDVFRYFNQYKNI